MVGGNLHRASFPEAGCLKSVRVLKLQVREGRSKLNYAQHLLGTYITLLNDVLQLASARALIAKVIFLGNSGCHTKTKKAPCLPSNCILDGKKP